MKEIIGEKANKYYATGISSIIHPVNPYVPIIHMNVRYFLLDNSSEWFGVGIDLTPHYIDPREARIFHKTLKELCDKYNPAFYPDFKRRADEYFYLPHRDETRGIRGIFFDRLKPKEEFNFDKLLSFTFDIAKAYPVIYSDIIRKKSNLAYSDSEQEWQRLRRGRYVEFNLICDKGTKFGLESKGNTESILISLPIDASWKFNHQSDMNSKEFATLRLLKKGINPHCR